MFFIKNQKLNQGGYVTLISVLILGAVGVSVTISIILLGLGSSRTSFALLQSAQAKVFVDTCVEEGLQQITDSGPFTGTDTLQFETGECTYTVVDDGGQNRTITASSTVGTIIRKVKVTIDSVNPQLNVASWQEVSDL